MKEKLWKVDYLIVGMIALLLLLGAIYGIVTAIIGVVGMGLFMGIYFFIYPHNIINLLLKKEEDMKKEFDMEKEEMKK